MNSLSPEKAAQLARRMAELGVEESQLEETFVRSAGHGGQNVNKTSTCVMLLHRPSGVQVKCQTTRQQGLNRFLARHLLLDKLAARRKERADAERARLEKARRQKRGRSRGAKERILRDKAHHSARKEGRRRVALD
jgi:peptide chain release factor